ncbi:MAG: V-type ATP synthase subunit E, partial [Bacteroidota bacterium]|nr:V-type ATP synthase subunit E [Bacteroidota bacterium]
YNEGVDKANKEAEEIIANAKNEAEKIQNEAEKEAKGIIDNAEKKANDTKKNVESELALAAKQTLRTIKQKITDLISYKAVSPQTKNAFNENDFVKKLIETVVGNWNPVKGEGIDLSVLLPEKLEKDFEQYFKGKAGKELNAGLELSFSDSIKGGFKIGPADGSYKISFSEEDFENFFKIYLRPKTIEILY